jgi:hypothetical protein
MYLVGIGLTFAGMGLLTAGIIIPGLAGIVIGSLILLKAANTKIRVRTLEEERQVREEMDRHKAEKTKKRRGGRTEETVYPCQNLVRNGLRDIRTSVADSLEALVSSTDMKEISYEDFSDELELLLVGVQWRWPEFDRFLEEVEGKRILPMMWREQGLLSWKVPPSANSILISYALKEFNELSKEAKLLFMRNGMLGVTEKLLIPMEEFRLKIPQEDFDGAMEALVRSGLVERLSSPADRMHLLPAASLVDIMEKYQIRVKGEGKDLVINEILDKVPYEDIEAIFKRENLPDEVVLGGIIVSQDISEAIRWERGQIRILAHTIYFTQKNKRALDALKSQEGDVLVKVVGDGNECTVCRDKMRSVFRKPVELEKLKPEDIPPFHPGCRCLLKDSKEG